MIDLSLLITIGVIFIITLVGAYMRSTRKDRCLKSWEGFHVTLERTNNKLIWGVLKVEPTGMELAYIDSVQDDRHVESSYLLYGSEYGEIQAIYRYPEKLSEWGTRRRTRDVARSFHPGPLRRLGRSGRNFLSTATDSLNEVLGIVLGRVQKSASRYLVDGGASLKTMMGSKVLGQVGALYDPLLEHYIGHRVAIELVEGAEVHEHVGIFKEYSGDFIEVLDVQFPHPQTIAMTPDMTLETNSLILLTEENAIRVLNCDARPILVASLHLGEREQMINAIVDSGETIELSVGATHYDQVKIKVQVVRELDMILPRTRCVVRHRAENIKKEELSRVILDFVFDVGRLIEPDLRREHTEALLRQDICDNPRDAMAAANLGFLLLQREELVEAEKWLRHALCMEYSLPDGGRRVRMELREIERRHFALNPQFDAVRVKTVQTQSSQNAGAGI
jgi:hypothetical protein